FTLCSLSSLLVVVVVLFTVMFPALRGQGKGRTRRRSFLAPILFLLCLTGLIFLMWIPDSWTSAIGEGVGNYGSLVFLVGTIVIFCWAAQPLARAAGWMLARSGRVAVSIGGARLASSSSSSAPGAAAIGMAVVAAGVVGGLSLQLYVNARGPADNLGGSRMIETSEPAAIAAAVPEAAVVVGSLRLGDSGEVERIEGYEKKGVLSQPAVTDCAKYFAVIKAAGATCKPGMVTRVLRVDGFDYVSASDRFVIDTGAGMLPLAVNPEIAVIDPSIKLSHVASPVVDASIFGTDQSWLLSATAGTVYIPAVLDERWNSIRRSILQIDPAARMETKAISTFSALRNSQHYYDWFAIATVLIIIICAAFALLASLVALLERRRLEAFVGIIGVPAQTMRVAWLVYVLAPITVLLVLAWIVIIVTNVAFVHLGHLSLHIPWNAFFVSALVGLGLAAVEAAIAVKGVGKEIDLREIR
ncbi:MAG: hypothetical protein ACRCSF_09365, partial [Mycobacteriaceae bacterium]